MDRTRWPGRWYRIAVTLDAAAEDLALGLLALAESRGSTSGPAGPGRIELQGWFDGLEAATAAA